MFVCTAQYVRFRVLEEHLWVYLTLTRQGRSICPSLTVVDVRTPTTRCILQHLISANPPHVFTLAQDLNGQLVKAPSFTLPLEETTSALDGKRKASVIESNDRWAIQFKGMQVGQRHKDD
jgi:hypothetical protein